MSVKLHHFRIGLFVLTGAALLVGALFAVGLKAYLGKREIFETYVTGKVENLSVGALVTLRGVTIGKGSSIEFIGTQYPEYKEQYALVIQQRSVQWDLVPNANKAAIWKMADMVEKALRSERHSTAAQRRKAFRDHLDRLATEAQAATERAASDLSRLFAEVAARSAVGAAVCLRNPR